MGHVGIHSNQLQLVMWRVVAQSCAKVCVSSISLVSAMVVSPPPKLFFFFLSKKKKYTVYY